MKPKKWICLPIVILSIITSFTQVHAEVDLIQEHSDWVSRVVVKDNDIRFRALTVYSERGDVVALTLDRLPNDCSSQYISMNVVLSAPAKSSIESRKYFGAFRVDEMKTHNINFNVTATAGSRFAFVTVTDFDQEATIIHELVIGRNVRFKLQVEGNEYYFRFSLLGFTSASTRSIQLCNAYNKIVGSKPDKDYFKPDRDYSFDNRVKSRNDKDYFKY